MYPLSLINKGFHNLSEALSNSNISVSATILCSVSTVAHLANWSLESQGNWLVFGIGASAGAFLSDRLEQRLQFKPSCNPACDNVIRAYYSLVFGGLPAPFITFNKWAAFCMSHSILVGLRTGIALRHLQHHLHSWAKR